MKYTQKPVSIFLNNMLLQSHEILHFVAISDEYQILNGFQTKRHHAVFLTLPRGRIKHVVFICWSHRDTYFHFTISHWFLSLRSVLSVGHMSINYLYWKWVTFFPALNCYVLPSSWSGVTSFPAKTLNCHIFWTRHTRIPVFALNWDLVTSILYTKYRAISSKGTLRVWPLLSSPSAMTIDSRFSG